jgi:hypothetical protein
LVLSSILFAPQFFALFTPASSPHTRSRAARRIQSANADTQPKALSGSLFESLGHCFIAPRFAVPAAAGIDLQT